MSSKHTISAYLSFEKKYSTPKVMIKTVKKTAMSDLSLHDQTFISFSFEEINQAAVIIARATVMVSLPAAVLKTGYIYSGALTESNAVKNTGTAFSTFCSNLRSVSIMSISWLTSILSLMIDEVFLITGYVAAGPLADA